MQNSRIQQDPNARHRALYTRVQPLCADTVTPRYATGGSAGLDLFAPSDVVVPPKTRIRVDIGFAVGIEPGYYGDIRSRSGLTLLGLDVCPGVVDSDYRGPVGVMLQNTTKEPIKIEKGRAIAQMLILQVWRFPVMTVEALPATARGEGGFGSTDSRPERDHSPKRNSPESNVADKQLLEKQPDITID